MSKFTIINRGKFMPSIEIFDGDTFISIELGSIGGTMCIHMSAEVAGQVAAKLLEFAERGKQEQAA